jgi:uncharacterized protein (UPF0335 family)
VDPVPDPLNRKSGSAGNRAQTSGSVARNSDHWTIEAIHRLCNELKTLLGNVKKIFIAFTDLKRNYV